MLIPTQKKYDALVNYFVGKTFILLNDIIDENPKFYYKIMEVKETHHKSTYYLLVEMSKAIPFDGVEIISESRDTEKIIELGFNYFNVRLLLYETKYYYKNFHSDGSRSFD